MVEQEYLTYSDYCLDIAEDWLLGTITDEEAYTLINDVGEDGFGETLLLWAEGVLKCLDM